MGNTVNVQANTTINITQTPGDTGQGGAENVVIDVTNKQIAREVCYKFQGNVLKTLLFHGDGECTDCNAILDLLRRANEKGVLFQKTGGKKITWNKDIPSMVWDFDCLSPCRRYLPKLKQSLAKLGIE